MRTLLLGIVLLVVFGVGGLVYRNAVEHPSRPIACPLDAKRCPDGTALSREGLSCTFPACPPPNVSLDAAGITYAVPSGFIRAPLPDSASLAAYELPAATSSSGSSARILVRRYAVAASSTPLSAIEATALSGTSGAPVPRTAFSSTVLGSRRYTVVSIERFEGVVDTAFYLARGGDILRFDAIDSDVAGWTDPALDIAALPAEAALFTLLSNLQG